MFTKHNERKLWKAQKFNEFSNEEFKREFYYHEGNNNKNNNIENDDSMSRYTYVRYMLFKKAIYNKSLINLDRLVITGKHQILVFYVRTISVFLCTVKTSVWYFPVMTALSVNKKSVNFENSLLLKLNNAFI